MKNLILFFTILFINLLNAKTSEQFDILITSNSIKINNIEITNKTSKAEILSLLGEPNRIKKNILDVEQNLIYDSLGLSIELNKETHLVEAVIVNYNWDNDEKMAKLPYIGTLKIDGYLITDLVKTNDLKKETSFKEIICMGEMLCMTKPGKDVSLIIGYNNDKKLTQIGFSCPR